MTFTSQETTDAILRLRDDGDGYGTIAKRLGVSKSTVRDVCKQAGLGGVRAKAAADPRPTPRAPNGSRPPEGPSGKTKQPQAAGVESEHAHASPTRAPDARPALTPRSEHMGLPGNAPASAHPPSERSDADGTRTPAPDLSEAHPTTHPEYERALTRTDPEATAHPPSERSDADGTAHPRSTDTPHPGPYQCGRCGAEWTLGEGEDRLDRCPSCDVSFLVPAGRCRACHAQIGVFHDEDPESIEACPGCGFTGDGNG